MKSLSVLVNERLQTSAGMLMNSFQVFRYEWETFVDQAKSAGLNHSDDPENKSAEIVYGKKSVIARWFEDDLEVTTSISKKDFFDIALRKQGNKLLSKILNT